MNHQQPARITFVLAWFLFALSSHGGCAASDKIELRAVDKSGAAQENFELRFMASGFAPDGTMLSINTYQGSFGHRLIIVHGLFPSPRAATDELHRKAKLARRVYSMEARKEVAGERAVVLFSATKSVPQQAGVLLTEGSNYFEVLSASLQVVLNFEEQSNKKRFKP